MNKTILVILENGEIHKINADSGNDAMNRIMKELSITYDEIACVKEVLNT